MKDEYDDEMLPEYDFSGPNVIQGKYADLTPENATVHITEKDGSVTVRPFMAHGKAIYLSSDVEAYFPDSEAVNAVLRALIPAIQKAKAQTSV